MSYPTFNLAHPPLMSDPNVWPPERSADDPVGQPFDVLPKDFFGVHDPKYPWVGMDHNSPTQWQQWKNYQTQQKQDVDHYVVVRTRYWKQTGRAAYGAETTAYYSFEVGTTYTHTKTTQDSTTQRVGIDLGLNLGGDMFGGGEVPPVPPVALFALPMDVTTQLAEEGDDGGGGSELSANFSYEFSHTLDITTTDESTFTTTRSVSRTMDFLANHQYIYWQISQSLTMYRVPVGSTNAQAIAAGNPIGTVNSKTKTVYVQDFDMSPGDDGSGDDGE
ncbi:MAG: hypothetical protein U9Q81_18125 [Pseudomonadota bacterium]|nr:hypothetical protein [Pseudomonadota bacterium]